MGGFSIANYQRVPSGKRLQFAIEAMALSSKFRGFSHKKTKKVELPARYVDITRG
jgi:hypothetical protein